MKCAALRQVCVVVTTTRTAIARTMNRDQCEGAHYRVLRN